MSFSHLYYTSAKGESHGFQVLAKSPDIDASLEEDRIVKVSAYNLPQSLKRLEQETDVLALAPRKFACYELKSGRFALTNVTYSGKDYTGRTGNFFADTIVFDEAALKGKGRPIDYFASPSFKTELTAAEVATTTGTLEVAASISKGTVITLEAIQAFLHSPGNLDIFKAMLQAVIDFPKTKKSLIIVDDIENVAKWIGAIQYSLPEKLAWSIPFTTYTHQYTFDYPDAIVFGVHSGEEVNPSWKSQFHVFNVANQQIPAIEAQAYVQQMAQVIGSSLETYEQFIQFVDLMTTEAVDAQLDSLIPLYLFVHGQLEDVAQEQLAVGLERYLEIEDLDTLLTLSDGILKKIAADENDCYELYSKLPATLVPKLSLKWMEIGKRHVGMKDLAVQFFYTSWESLMIDDRTDANTKALHRFADEAIALNKGNAPFHKRAYEKDRLELLYANLKEEERQTLWETWIKYMLIHLAENDVAIEQAAHQNDWLFEMLDYGLRMDFDFTRVFDIFFADAELVEHVVAICLDGLHQFDDAEQLHKMIANILDYTNRIPASEPLYERYIATKGYVQQYLVAQALQHVRHSTTPISDLEKAFSDELKHVEISEEKKDVLVGEAANTLLASHCAPAIFLGQLKGLLQHHDEELAWARRLPVETTIGLLNRALDEIVLQRDTAENYAIVRSFSALLEDYPSPKMEEMHAKLAFINQLSVITIDKKLDSATLSKLIELAGGQERAQLLDILKIRLPLFAQTMSLSIKQSQAFYSAILPELDAMYVSELVKANESHSKVQALASYIDYKLANDEPLAEEMIAYLQGNKKVMKELEEAFHVARLKDTFSTLKLQVQGSNKLAEISSKFKGFFKLEGRKDKGNTR